LETVLGRDALWDGIVMALRAELAVHGALAVGVLADGARLARAIRLVIDGVRGLEPAEGALDTDVDDGDAAVGEAALVLGPALGALWAFYARGAEHGVAAEGAVAATGTEAAVGATADRVFQRVLRICFEFCASVWHVVNCARFWYQCATIPLRTFPVDLGDFKNACCHEGRDHLSAATTSTATNVAALQFGQLGEIRERAIDP
jgi:hypothetical protein